MEKYDVFISYRRKEHKEVARLIQLALQKYKYRVFLDLEEIRDGHFDDCLIKSIDSSTVFLLLLSESSMSRCSITDDWVAHEIRYAIQKGKKIVPITINKDFKSFPDDTPNDIRSALETLQFSNIDTDSLFQESVRKIVKDRIKPSISPKSNRKVLIGLVLIFILFVSIGLEHVICTQTESNEEACAADSIFDNSYVSPETQKKIFEDIAGNMVYIGGGEFEMHLTFEKGDTLAEKITKAEAKRIKVKSFKLSKYEVTQEQWMAVTGEKPAKFRGAHNPVECVSFADCQKFVVKLNQLAGTKYRIPTEAEWAYAAHGGTKSKGYRFCGGNNLDDVAWNVHNSGSRTHPVGQKIPNELGLYDMCGNVWEWTNDRMKPADGQIEEYIIRRGGSWTCDEKCCLGTTQNFQPATYKSEAIGLRLAE